MLTGILDQVFHFSRCPASSNITSGFALCAKEQPFGSKANAEYAFEAGCGPSLPEGKHLRGLG